MAVSLRNPMTIMASDAGATDSTVKVTNYGDGTIVGTNFGTTQGVVYLLNRDTHSYVQQSVSTWSDKEIVLANPIDTSVIEGTTCFFVRTAKGRNSNKFLIEGEIAVTGYYYLYVKDPLTGTIHKLKADVSSQMPFLVGTAPTVTSGYVNSTFYGKDVVLDNLNFHTSQIVGVQFGSSISYTIPAYFLMGLINLDQPVVIRSGMTINNNSNYFMFNCRNFNCPLVFDGLTSNQTRPGSYFMGKCTSFNQPLNLDRFKYLNATNFMSNCWSFNSELTLTQSLNSSARAIGTYFMERCVSFDQPLTLPNNITSVGNYFMYCCSAFNHPLEFDLSISGSSIGTYFMAYCYGFNQALDFSHTQITATPNYFMYCCKSFNSPIKFPTTLTSIGSYFLACTTGTTTTITTNLAYGGSFNQDLDLPNVTSISTYFLANQVSFNSQVNFPKATGIGNYFMQNCTVFAQPITLPSTLTTVGAYFMANVLTTRKMTVNTSAVPATTALTQTTTTSAYAPSQIDGSCPAVARGVYLYGTQRSAWLTGLPNSLGTSPYRNLIDGEA